MTRFVFFAVLACGMQVFPATVNAGAGHTDAHAVAHASYGRPGDPKKVSRTIRIEATEIAFNLQQMIFKKGETVKFVLVNKGEQDHELTIADSSAQKEHRKMMETMTPEMMQVQGHDHQSSVMAKPGESSELVWQFTKAGQFEFACNFPGHAEIGMQGKIVVR